MSDIYALELDLIAYMRNNAKGHENGIKRHRILAYLNGKGHKIADEGFRKVYRELAVREFFGSHPDWGYFTIENYVDFVLTFECKHNKAMNMLSFCSELKTAWEEKNSGQGSLL